MRNGVHEKRAKQVPIGKTRISPAGSRRPAVFAAPKRKRIRLDRQKALALGAVLLLILGIAIGTGRNRQPRTPLSAVVSANGTTETEPADPAQGSTILKVCVGDKLQEMGLEEYILRVVAAEMPASYELEALKAQAVAARTYTLRKKMGGGCKKIEGAEICSDHTHCQAGAGL